MQRPVGLPLVPQGIACLLAAEAPAQSPLPQRRKSARAKLKGGFTAAGPRAKRPDVGKKEINSDERKFG